MKLLRLIAYTIRLRSLESAKWVIEYEENESK